MINVTYLICGVRVERTTTLAIELRGCAPASTPALHHLSRCGREQEVVGNEGRWTVELEAGDHVVRIVHDEYENYDWPGVTAILSRAGILVTSRTNGTFMAWEAELTGSDPKDPWPPPGVTQTLADAQWFQQTFGSLQVIVAKCD